MNAILFDVHSYERAVFNGANTGGTHQLTYVRTPLDTATARLPAAPSEREQDRVTEQGTTSVATAVGKPNSYKRPALTWPLSRLASARPRSAAHAPRMPATAMMTDHLAGEVRSPPSPPSRPRAAPHPGPHRYRRGPGSAA